MTDLRAPDGTLLFHHKELACPCCDGFALDPGFADHLVTLRLKWARPMIVNSCCRCEKRNITVGGHARSLHVFANGYWSQDGTAAIDLKVGDGVQGGELTVLALSLGWSVGVPAKNFIHLDRRDLFGLKAKTLFGYGG